MKMRIIRGSSLPIPAAILLVSLPVLIVFCALGSFPTTGPYVLEVINTKDNGQVFRANIWEEDRFSLEYKHSVQLSGVTDIYEIDRQHRIVLVGITFSDHGAGLPHKSHLGGRFSVLPDGKFSISNMHMVMPEIRLRVGKESENVLKLSGKNINLSKRYGDSLLIIRIRRYSILKRLRRSLSNVI